MKDPLDHKIDALLASRPVRPSDDFATRVLAAAEAEARSPKNHKRPLGKLLAFALPIAAAVVLTLSLLQIGPNGEPTNDATSALSKADAQEIFLLEESLSSFAEFDTANFGGDALLSTLDALYLEI